MLEGAECPAVFLWASLCKDPLLAWAARWPRRPLKHLMESCVQVPEHLPALRGQVRLSTLFLLHPQLAGTLPQPRGHQQL